MITFSSSGSRNTFSILAIWVIILSWGCFCYDYDNHQRRLVASDAIHYYSYLPAAFIEKDLSLSFVNANNLKDYDYYYLPEYTPEGNKLIKTTMGLAILLAPFFLLAHLLAPFFTDHPNGFTQIYQIMTGIVGAGFYFLAGLWYLRKLLLRFFSDKVTATTLLIIVFGTNLIYYTFGEPLIAHVFLFSLLAIFLYASVRWCENHLLKHVILLALCGGFMTLIRPTMILFLPFPVLYGISSAQTARLKWQELQKNYKQVLLAMGILFLCALPQLIYWKAITGHWVYFSYTNERFYWNQPHLIEMWFSYRKGWLIYTPAMLFAIGGFFFLPKYAKGFILPLLLSLPLMFYILSCWWVWWYGGSISQRTYVDFYALLAIPLACYLQILTEVKNGLLRIMNYTLVFLLSLFSLFKVWQYTRDLIHHDGMNEKLYRETLFATEPVDSYWSKLHLPNYSRALRGLPQYLKCDGRTLLIREDIDLSKGAFCENGHAQRPELSIAFPDLRIPHGNRLYGVADFTSDESLSDSCRLVIEITNPNGTWTQAIEPLNKFAKNNRGRASAYILFTSSQSEQDILKVYVQNPLKEQFCIQSLMMGEEVY